MCLGDAQGQSIQSPYAIVKPLDERYQTLRFSEIQPTGWIKEQMQKDLAGFTGHLDSLVPDLIIKDDIYGKNRLTKSVKNKDVGAISDGGDWQVQFLWWNSETQSNWWDGYIRTAIMTQDPKHLIRVSDYVKRILATQAPADGYLGIYDKELRYKFDNENGELWSKATLLRGLLAWYEYTNDKAILGAVELAAENVMKNYPIGKSHPFYSVNPNAGGLTHGLVFTDVLEKLYQLNKDKEYKDYCIFLYKDFSRQVLNEDAQYKKLIDTSLTLNGHGVHTYEHLRSLAAAYYASGNPELEKAIDAYLKKIRKKTMPSGAPVGDEFIFGRNADATSTGYEYCSTHELMNGYTDLFAKMGNNNFAELAEQIFFNAAQGARHPNQSAIAYLKTDNSYFMMGWPNADSSQKTQTRYKYSPVHQDAAVCCVPNAGRITPYFVQNMWVKDKDALVAVLLGPCEVNTELNGKKISIREKTSYPYSFTVAFEIEVNQAATFELRIRKPSWVKKFTVSGNWIEKDGFIIVKQVWKGKQTVKIQFYPDVTVKQDQNEEYYFTYGPLVLAHAIESIESKTKAFPLAGFSDIQSRPSNLVIYQYINSKIQPVNDASDKISFTTELYNPANGKNDVIFLEPMGKTTLRQVTFKAK